MKVEIRAEDPQFPEKKEHKWDFRCSAEQKNVPTADNFFKLSIFLRQCIDALSAEKPIS
jgi:hypothetical protein